MLLCNNVNRLTAWNMKKTNFLTIISINKQKKQALNNLIITLWRKKKCGKKTAISSILVGWRCESYLLFFIPSCTLSLYFQHDCSYTICIPTSYYTKHFTNILRWNPSWSNSTSIPSPAIIIPFAPIWYLFKMIIWQIFMKNVRVYRRIRHNIQTRK